MISSLLFNVEFGLRAKCSMLYMCNFFWCLIWCLRRRAVQARIDIYSLQSSLAMHPTCVSWETIRAAEVDVSFDFPGIWIFMRVSPPERRPGPDSGKLGGNRYLHTATGPQPHRWPVEVSMGIKPSSCLMRISQKPQLNIELRLSQHR